MAAPAADHGLPAVPDGHRGARPGTRAGCGPVGGALAARRLARSRPVGPDRRRSGRRLDARGRDDRRSRDDAGGGFANIASRLLPDLRRSDGLRTMLPLASRHRIGPLANPGCPDRGPDGPGLLAGGPTTMLWAGHPAMGDGIRLGYSLAGA